MALINYITQVQFDFGALALLQQECDRIGIRKPLIVTDMGIRNAGILDKVVAQLKDGAQVAVFDQTPPNPNENAVRAAVKMFRDGVCDGIIAVGGGSSIDLAKGVAVCGTHEGTLKSFALIEGGLANITAKTAPVIAIPTTAGTGSGRNGDHRRRLGGDVGQAAFDQGEGLQRAFMRAAYGHALGEVDRRTAAHGDDAVTDTVAEHLDRSAHGVFIRVRGSLIKHGDLCTVFQLGDNLVEDACVANTHIGDDQRFADTDAVAFLLQQRECAEVELNLGNVVNQCHYIALKL